MTCPCSALPSPRSSHSLTVCVRSKGRGCWLALEPETPDLGAFKGYVGPSKQLLAEESRGRQDGLRLSLVGRSGSGRALSGPAPLAFSKLKRPTHQSGRLLLGAADSLDRETGREPGKLVEDGIGIAWP